jgi:hypothetical protein
MSSNVRVMPTDFVSSSQPSTHPSPEPAPLPLRAPKHRPLVDTCVVHRSEEINAAERNIEFPLVAIIHGSRHVVSVPEVHRWLQEFFGIPEFEVKIQHHFPKDFIITSRIKLTCSSFLSSKGGIASPWPVQRTSCIGSWCRSGAFLLMLATFQRCDSCYP